MGPALPMQLGGLSFRILAEDLFFFCLSIFSPGGNANSGGAPMQALAPGRWRPSARHALGGAEEGRRGGAGGGGVFSLGGAGGISDLVLFSSPSSLCITNISSTNVV